jgi:competence protein ComEA
MGRTVRQGPSSPIAACGAILVALALGSLAARHRAEHPARPAAPIEAPPASTAGPLDLNAASADALERLPRIGPALARRIVDDRAANGPFRSVDELERVRGIGPATLDALRPLVVAGPSLALPGSER